MMTTGSHAAWRYGIAVYDVGSRGARKQQRMMKQIRIG